MLRIPVDAAAGRYEVMVGRGLLASAGDLLRDAGLEGQLRLISDENVFELYGSLLEESLRAEGFIVDSQTVVPGEASKSLDVAARLYDWLVETGTERRDIVLALGGGVVGDLAGFVAATYLRGVRLVQLPTSLLAQVDSSVGGKVAVNHARGKNLIGAFYPPSLVIIDSRSLSSLPARELSAALAEVVKMGVILDPDLFDLLESEVDRLLTLDPPVVEQVIARSVELKAGVVRQDEREAGLRAILNYGHTIGHGVEAASDYLLYRHGEAVAIGMEGASRLAMELGLCSEDLPQRQGSLLRRFGLPLNYRGVAGDAILRAMRRDKKASRGRLAWVLPEMLGKVAIHRDVPEPVVERVLAGLAG